MNHIQTFSSRKEILRRIRYKRSHESRQTNLSKLGSLYKEISMKTTVRGEVAFEVLSDHNLYE
jgi:hypothetical protein